MDDFTKQEPVIVADPSGNVKAMLEKLEQDLAPMLSKFLTNNDPEGFLRMQESVDSFFSDEWVAHVTHDVMIEHVPGNGWLVTVGIDYDQLEDLNDIHGVNFMLDMSKMDNIDDLLEATLGGESDEKTETGEVAGSVDDILFSPIKKPQPVVQDESVTDIDLAIYDGCGCQECVCI